MLENKAYNVLDNTELKLEKKIEAVEISIKEIDEKIVVAQTINDKKSLEALNYQRDEAVITLEKLKSEYKVKTSEVKLTSFFISLSSTYEKLKKNIEKYFRYVLRNFVIFKSIKPLVRSLMVKDTIKKLNQINKSVDELIKMQVPFGEQEARYAVLVNHLAQAGSLHSQILKEFNS